MHLTMRMRPLTVLRWSSDEDMPREKEKATLPTLVDWRVGDSKVAALVVRLTGWVCAQSSFGTETGPSTSFESPCPSRYILYSPMMIKIIGVSLSMLHSFFSSFYEVLFML